MWNLSDQKKVVEILEKAERYLVIVECLTFEQYQIDDDGFAEPVPSDVFSASALKTIDLVDDIEMLIMEINKMKAKFDKG